MSEERRSSPRVTSRMEAQVRFTSWATFSFIYAINISRGGMSLELTEEAPVGTKLAVLIQPPKGELIELQAVVRHSGAMPTRAAPPQPVKEGAAAQRGAPPRYQVGVEFIDLDEKRRAAIEQLLTKHGAPPGASGLAPRKG
jgi:hypothetical protein